MAQNHGHKSTTQCIQLANEPQRSGGSAIVQVSYLHSRSKTMAGLHDKLGIEEKIHQHPADAGRALLSKVSGALR